MERVELAAPFLSYGLIDRFIHGGSHIFTNRIPRNPHHPGYLTYPFPLPAQYPDFHTLFLCLHADLLGRQFTGKVGQFLVADVGHFHFAANSTQS
nr:hypothetical protein [Desulfobulbus elongatus]